MPHAMRDTKRMRRVSARKHIESRCRRLYRTSKSKADSRWRRARRRPCLLVASEGRMRGLGSIVDSQESTELKDSRGHRLGARLCRCADHVTLSQPARRWAPRSGSTVQRLVSIGTPIFPLSIYFPRSLLARMSLCALSLRSFLMLQFRPLAFGQATKSSCGSRGIGPQQAI